MEPGISTTRDDEPANYRRLKLRNLQLLLDDIHSKTPVFRGSPDVLHLHHTDRCELRCIMCPQSENPGTRELPLTTVRQLLDELLPSARLLRLTTAGEALEGEVFEECVERVRRYQCHLDLATNGLGLTLPRYRAMEDHLDRITISFDSHRPEIFDAIRGGGTFARLTQNLLEIGTYAKQSPKNILSVFNVVFMKTNAPSLPEYIQFAEQSLVDYVRLLRLRPLTAKAREEDPFVHLGPEERAQIFRDMAKEARARKVNLLLEDLGEENVLCHHPREPRPEIIPTFACQSAMREVVVHPDGSVFPCDQPTNLRMGNLLQRPFSEIWNRPRYRKLRRQMFAQKLSSTCRDCYRYSLFPDPSQGVPAPGEDVFRHR